MALIQSGNKKIIILFPLIIVIGITAYVLINPEIINNLASSLSSLAGESKLTGPSISKEIVTHTPSTETYCANGKCTKAKYSGTRFTYEDNTWKKVEDARSLMGVYEIIYLEQDSRYDIKVIDYNYTSIQIETSVKDSKELGKEIPVRFYRIEYNESGDKIKTLEKEELNSYSSLDSKKHTKADIQDSIMAYEIHLGEKSTTIMLQDADTECLEDAETSKYSVPYVYDMRYYVKFTIEDIPIGRDILDSILCLYWYAEGAEWDGDVTYYRVDQQTWKEELTIPATLSGYTKDNQKDASGMWFDDYEFDCINVTDIIDADYTAGNSNTTIRIEGQSDAGITPDYGENATTSAPIGIVLNMGGSPKNYASIRTKESVVANLRPYLNITYSDVADEISPNVTIEAPVNSTETESNTIDVNYTVGDNVAVDKCWWINATGGNNSLPNCQNTTQTLINGSYSITIYLNDTSGNQNYSSRGFTIAVPLPPEYYFYYSDNSTNTTIAGADTEFRLKWSCDNALDGYIFSFHNGSNISSSCSGTPLGCGNYSSNATCSDAGCNWTGGEGESYTEDFETFTTDLGDWVTSWLVDSGCVWQQDIDGTPSSTTGPCSGASNCAGDDAGYDDNNYAYVETSYADCNTGTGHAYLNYTGIDMDAYPNMQLYFAYNMYGANMGTLNVKINTSSGWDTLWSLNGNQGTDWYTQNVSLGAYDGIRTISFDYDRNGQTSWQGDVAVDVLNISQSGGDGGECSGSEYSCPTFNDNQSLCENANCSYTPFQEFINDTYVSFSDCTTECWSNVSKMVNSTVGATIKWQIWANNSEGSSNTSLIYSYITIEAEAEDNSPIVTLDSPENGNVTTSTSVTVQCNITDDNSISNISLWTNTSGVWALNQTINISTMCYQEYANVSTFCGGLDTGIYNGVPYNVRDGDWETCAGGNWGGYINYTKPDGALNTSIWRVSDDNYGGETEELTIPEDCWNYNDTYLFFHVASSLMGDNQWDCMNATGEHALRYNEGSCMIEEAMLWDIENLTVSTPSYNASFDLDNLGYGIYKWNCQAFDNATQESWGTSNWTFTVVEPEDTCTYTSGHWEVDCSDNCNIITNYNLGGNNLTLEGTGTFYINANITNIDIIAKDNNCEVIKADEYFVG